MGVGQEAQDGAWGHSPRWEGPGQWEEGSAKASGSCAHGRGAQLSGPLLMGPLQTPRWVKGVLWCPVPDPSEGCPCLLFSCQAGSTSGLWWCPVLCAHECQEPASSRLSQGMAPLEKVVSYQGLCKAPQAPGQGMDTRGAPRYRLRHGWVNTRLRSWGQARRSHQHEGQGLQEKRG